MSSIRKKYDEEFKKNAVKFSYASPKTVKEISDDLGVGENLLYNWRKKHTKDGDKSRSTTLEEENKALRLEENTSEHGARQEEKTRGRKKLSAFLKKVAIPTVLFKSFRPRNSVLIRCF